MLRNEITLSRKVKSNLKGEIMDKEEQLKTLREKLNRLELESIDLHTYQANTVQLSVDDVGPANEEPAREQSQRLWSRINAINDEIADVKEQLRNIKED